MKKVAAEPYRDIDFSTAKRGSVIPLEPGKTKISIRIDNAVIEFFRVQSECNAKDYFPASRPSRQVIVTSAQSLSASENIRDSAWDRA